VSLKALGVIGMLLGSFLISGCDDSLTGTQWETCTKICQAGPKKVTKSAEMAELVCYCQGQTGYTVVPWED
jgi:hypothetical protein